MFNEPGKVIQAVLVVAQSARADGHFSEEGCILA